MFRAFTTYLPIVAWPWLRCIRVDLPAALRGRRYLGCLLRLLAADDPSVDLFVSRDLDDGLDPAGLRLVARRLGPRRRANAHVQAEPYATPHRADMFNLGWFGQRRLPGQPSVRDAIARFVRPPANDYYTADEVFLTDVWVPLLRARLGARLGLVGLPSHAYRRAAGPRPAAFRDF
jgi:hypothetical protein